MTVGKVTKIFLAVVVAIVVINAVFFAFNAGLWFGIASATIGAVIGVGLVKFVKKPSSGGRWW